MPAPLLPLAQITIKPRTIFCRDNLEILRGINSDTVDLIYLDPPFNKGRNFHAPIGTSAEGADFSDIWTPDSVKDEWHTQISDTMPGLYKYLDAVGDVGSRSAKYYLIYMAVRLIEMRRVLKNTGSIYLHCDPSASHYLKLLMDVIFGTGNFRNEIIWKKYAGRKNNARKKFGTQHESIFLYTASKHTPFYPLFVPHAEKEIAKKYNHQDEDGRRYRLTWGRNYQLHGAQKRIYLDESPGRALGNLWVEDGLQLNTSSAERLYYPTQKPLALIERIIQASSVKGDLVLDPFCGCATTCVAAEKLERKWIGIDVSQKAFELVKMRLDKEVLHLLDGKPFLRKDIPVRTDISHRKKPSAKDKQLLFGKQNGQCAGCGSRFDIRHLTIDHIIPQSSGGSHELTNLQLLCSHCNSIKGSRPMEYLRAKIKHLYK